MKKACPQDLPWISTQQTAGVQDGHTTKRLDSRPKDRGNDEVGQTAGMTERAAHRNVDIYSVIPEVVFGDPEKKPATNSALDF